MKKSQAIYRRYRADDPIVPGFEGRRVLIYHVSGHHHVTPNHPAVTSRITKVFKNGRFHTENTIWTLDPIIDN